MSSKLRVFEIELDGDQFGNVYSPGQMLNGQVRVVLDEALIVKSLRLIFDGRAHVEWTESRSDRDANGNESTHTDTYSDEQIYFEKQLILWGQSQLQKSPPPTSTPTLSVGEHVFPFKFPIPNASLPSNLKSFYGRIAYLVKAQLDRPTFTFDYRTEKQFTIRSVYDLTLEPRARHPTEANGDKSLCCWCCASGRIVCDLRLPKTGYVEGETIEAVVDVFNYSLSSVRKVSVQLLQQHVFKVKPATPAEQSKTTSKILVETSRHERIASRGVLQWPNASLKIPPTSVAPPSIDRRTCRILQIEYYVVAEIVPKGCSRKFDVRVPIIIGTSPVMAIESMSVDGGAPTTGAP